MARSGQEEPLKMSKKGQLCKATALQSHRCLPGLGVLGRGGGVDEDPSWGEQKKKGWRCCLWGTLV